MTRVPNVTFNNGVEFPQLGFGTYKTAPEEAVAAVNAALAAGYRAIDTAALYGNEAEIGDAVAASDIPRSELFITTKLWNSDQGFDSTLRAFDDSLAKLKLDYIDLYLIHWPAPATDRYVETWRAFEKLHAQGLIRSIGVSNFQPSHLQRLFDETEIVPAINQIELHPLLPQRELREFHAQHGIATQAWAPIARGALNDHPVLTQLSDKHGKSPAQVLIRWHLQLGNVVIPKSVTPSRIVDNIDVFDFELDESDLIALATLENGHRTGPDPDTFD